MGMMEDIAIVMEEALEESYDMGGYHAQRIEIQRMLSMLRNLKATIERDIDILSERYEFIYAKSQELIEKTEAKQESTEGTAPC